MRQFITPHLDAVVKAEKVETPEETLEIAGPLSEAFTKALYKVLKKKDGEVLPVLESFTDPEVIRDYIVDRISRRKDRQSKPTLIFVYNRHDITEKVLSDAMVATAARDTDQEVTFLSTNAIGTSMESHAYKRHPLALEKAMEVLATRLGANHVKL